MTSLPNADTVKTKAVHQELVNEVWEKYSKYLLEAQKEDIFIPEPEKQTQKSEKLVTIGDIKKKTSTQILSSSLTMERNELDIHKYNTLSKSNNNKRPLSPIFDDSVDFVIDMEKITAAIDGNINSPVQNSSTSLKKLPTSIHKISNEIKKNADETKFPQIENQRGVHQQNTPLVAPIFPNSSRATPSYKQSRRKQQNLPPSYSDHLSRYGYCQPMSSHNPNDLGNMTPQQRMVSNFMGATDPLLSNPADNRNINPLTCSVVKRPYFHDNTPPSNNMCVSHTPNPNADTPFNIPRCYNQQTARPIPPIPKSPSPFLNHPEYSKTNISAPRYQNSTFEIPYRYDPNTSQNIAIPRFGPQNSNDITGLHPNSMMINQPTIDNPRFDCPNPTNPFNSIPPYSQNTNLQPTFKPHTYPNACSYGSNTSTPAAPLSDQPRDILKRKLALRKLIANRQYSQDCRYSSSGSANLIPMIPGTSSTIFPSHNTFQIKIEENAGCPEVQQPSGQPTTPIAMPKPMFMDLHPSYTTTPEPNMEMKAGVPKRNLQEYFGVEAASTKRNFQEHLGVEAATTKRNFQEHLGVEAATTKRNFQEHLGAEAAPTKRNFQEHFGVEAAPTKRNFQEHFGVEAAPTKRNFQEQLGVEAAPTKRNFQEHLGVEAAPTKTNFQEHLGVEAATTKSNFQEHLGVEAAPIKTNFQELLGVEAAPTKTNFQEHLGVEAAPTKTNFQEHLGVKAATTKSNFQEHLGVEAAPIKTNFQELLGVEAAPTKTNFQEHLGVEAATTKRNFQEHLGVEAATTKSNFQEHHGVEAATTKSSFQEHLGAEAATTKRNFQEHLGVESATTKPPRKRRTSMPHTAAALEQPQDIEKLRKEAVEKLSECLKYQNGLNTETVTMLRHFQYHLCSCTNRVPASAQCSDCYKIFSAFKHSLECQNPFCNNIICEIMMKKSIDTYFGDPEFVRGFLKNLGIG